jgi:CheY-like chemotaxis protein
MANPASGRTLGWVLAVLGPAGVAGLGLLLAPTLDAHVLAPFVLAIAGASLVGGLGPGLFAAAASALAVNYWFFPPSGRLGFASDTDLAAQLLFWAVALLVAALSAWSRASRLRAESEAERLGAEVHTMTSRLIPNEQPRPEAGQAGPKPTIRRTAHLQPTALVAIDDPEARQLACHALESSGLRWLSACDATEALELANRYDFPVELAVIDVLLPDMRGESLAERLRGRHAKISVLYTSNVPHDELVRRGLLQAGEPLLAQPFTADRLLDAVRDLAVGRHDPELKAAEQPDALVVSDVDR